MTGFKATGRILIVEDDKNIAALLQKYLILETEPSCPTYILTKRGVGYHFTERTRA